MESYIPEDSYYNEATNLEPFMGERGDVNAIQNMLQCNQALRHGKPKARQKLRRERKSDRPELQIKGPVWTDMLPELRLAWICKDDRNKDRVIAQFKEPITKNCQLTAYEARSYSDGYESDFTTNTQNSEGTFCWKTTAYV